jgi:hypothetical protein
MQTVVTTASPQKTPDIPLCFRRARAIPTTLVVPLDDAVLLRAVRRGVVALNTLIRTVRCEFSRCEFAAVFGAQHA